MREHSTMRPLGLLLFWAVTTFFILGTLGQPTPSPTPVPQHPNPPPKGVLSSRHTHLDPPVFGVHLSQLPQQQANELYKQSLDEINVKKVASTLADNYLKLQGQELSQVLGFKNHNQDQAPGITTSAQAGQKPHPQVHTRLHKQRQLQRQKPVLTEVTPPTFVKFRVHATVNEQQKRKSLVKKPLVKTPHLLQSQARVVNDFHVKNKYPFALFNKTDFAPIHSEAGRERSFSSFGSEENSHYKVKRDDRANIAKKEGEEKRRSSLHGASLEIDRDGKRRPKDLVRKYRYSTLELKEDEHDERPDVFFSDGFGSFDDFAKSFHEGSSFGEGKKVEGKFTPFSGEVDHGRQRHPGYSSLNSESHYSGHGGKHRTTDGPSHGASYEDHRSSSEHGSSNNHGDDHHSGHKSIYTDHKPKNHYEEDFDSHHEHGQRETSHSHSRDVDFSKPRPSDVLRNPSHDYVDDHFQYFEYDDESSHLRSSGKGSGSPFKGHGKFEQSHESHGSGVSEEYRFSLFRGDHDKIQGGKHFSDIQHFEGPTSHGSHHHGKEHHNADSDEDKHNYHEPHHDEGHHTSSHHGSSHHGSSNHGSSHHGSSHHGSSPRDETPVYTYVPEDEGKHSPGSHEESNYHGQRSLGTTTHYKPLVHNHPPIDHSRPHHGGGSSFGRGPSSGRGPSFGRGPSSGRGSHHGGGSSHEDEYDGQHHSAPHPHSSPVVESVKQVFNSEYYEKLAESLVSKMNDDQLISMGGKNGKRETGSHSPSSAEGHSSGNGPRPHYTSNGGRHHQPGRHHFKRSDKTEQEKAALQQAVQYGKNSNPSPTSFSRFQNPGKPLNSGGDNFHKEEDVRNAPEFRKNTDSRDHPHSHRDHRNSKSREPKFGSEEKPQRPGNGHSHSGEFHPSNSVGPREPRPSPYFTITPNSGPRHSPPHFGPRAPNHSRPRSPNSNFNPHHLRSSPAHPPHLPPRPLGGYNAIAPLGNTLMSLYNSIPTVNWSNRPVNRNSGPPPSSLRV